MDGMIILMKPLGTILFKHDSALYRKKPQVDVDVKMEEIVCDTTLCG